MIRRQDAKAEERTGTHRRYMGSNRCTRFRSTSFGRTAPSNDANRTDELDKSDTGASASLTESDEKAPQRLCFHAGRGICEIVRGLIISTDPSIQTLQ